MIENLKTTNIKSSNHNKIKETFIHNINIVAKFAK